MTGVQTCALPICIIPDFRDDAPLERHIIEQRMWMLDDNSFVGTHYRSDDYNKPPYNRYTIIRAQFDKWFSSKVREAGARIMLISDGDVAGVIAVTDDEVARVRALYGLPERYLLFVGTVD